MSHWSVRPGLSTSAEASLLTALNNLAAGGAGTAIQKLDANTFVNITVPGSGTLVVASGGTGATSFTAYAVITAGTTSTGAFQNVSGLGSSGQVLTSNGAGQLPTWQPVGSGAIVVGTTSITSGSSGRVLYDNAGVVGEMTTTGSGTVLALATSPVLVTPTLGVASATSLATSAASPFLITNGQLLTVAVTSQTTGGATLTIPDFASVSDEFVFKTKSVTMSNKTFVAPVLGAATATSINGLIITSTAATLTLANSASASLITAGNFGLTLTATATTNSTFPAGTDTLDGLATSATFTGIKTFSPTARSSGVASYFVINTPADTAQTASTESIGIKTVTATRTWATTGTVGLQREIYLAGVTYASASASQTFTDITTLYIDKPLVGSNAVFTRAHSLTIVDSTSAASSITGGFVISTTLGTTATSVGIGGGNINAGGTLTVGGHVTLEGVTSTGATGTGKLVFDGTPTLVTPVLGAATATSINGLIITTTTGTITMTNSKTLAVTNTITLSGTDSTVWTGPSTSFSVARIDAAQTFTGTQTFAQIVTTSNAITASGNAATVPITSRISTVTNNSAATLTITITTTSAVDGMLVMVRILDFSAVAQTITWVNTENSTVTAPVTSNGSTSLPLTVGFQYNTSTSKWRCIASA